MSAVESSNGRIVVEQPGPGDPISSVVEVNGLSDTYEATVLIVVRDGDGSILAEASATGGMMGLKPFSGRLVLERQPSSSEASIEVTELGGKEGAVVESALVPVRFE